MDGYSYNKYILYNNLVTTILQKIFLHGHICKSSTRYISQLWNFALYTGLTYQTSFGIKKYDQLTLNKIIVLQVVVVLPLTTTPPTPILSTLTPTSTTTTAPTPPTACSPSRWSFGETLITHIVDNSCLVTKTKFSDLPYSSPCWQTTTRPVNSDF